MGKKPLNESQVKTLRKLTSDSPLHSLLLNLSVDLMLRASDLLRLQVSDVMTASGVSKESVQVRQKKTGKTTLEIPLSPYSRKVIEEHLQNRNPNDFVFKGQKSHYTRKAITTQQYQRIIKKWMRELGIEDVSGYSSHSMRKTKASVLYKKTSNVEAVRRLLGHQSVTATSSYLGVEDEDAAELARKFSF